jgi:hypothetical protein
VPGECIKVSAAELGCASGLTSAIVRAANSIVDVGYSIAQKKARNNAIKAQLSGKFCEIKAKYELIKNAQSDDIRTVQVYKS